jgi:IS30 family transposase
MARKRNKAERERDRKRINELYLNGWTQQAIADEVGVHRLTVNADIKHLQNEWKAKRDNLKEEFATKYEHIYQEAMAAWARSIRNGSSGKPALLAQAQNSLKAIREMFGVDAPLENNVNLRVDDTVNKALERIYADNSD